MEADYSNDEVEIEAIKTAIDHGITHIDTAELYGAGHAEELVGQAIKGYDRSKLIIATKVSAENQRHDDLLRSFEASLKRLDTDYIDLYLLHRYPANPIAETMKALDELVEQGVVKNIGVCNFTPRRFDEAQKHTKNKLVYDQVHYSLDCREAEKYGLVEYCQKSDVLLCAWGPLSKGALEKALILDEMAKKYGKTPYQIALNWLITQPNVITIPKTTHVEHLEENLGVLGWNLSGGDMEKLTKDFPNQRQVSDRVPLDYPGNIEP